MNGTLVDVCANLPLGALVDRTVEQSDHKTALALASVVIVRHPCGEGMSFALSMKTAVPKQAIADICICRWCGIRTTSLAMDVECGVLG